MKVILNTDVPNLGEEGDILEVKPGYARNFLLPKQLVSLYNRTSLAVLEGKRTQIERKKEERRKAALSDKVKIDGASVVFKMPAGENGKLFGAVTAQMVCDALEAQGIIVERKKVEIPGHTLKALGDYRIHIRLYNEAAADLKVKVVAEGAVESATEAGREAAKTESAEAAQAPAADAPEASAPSAADDTTASAEVETAEVEAADAEAAELHADAGDDASDEGTEEAAEDQA